MADDPTLYVQLADLKKRLGIDPTDTTEDDNLTAACNGASRAVDMYCERQFYQVTEARTLVPQGLYWVKLPAFCDLVSVSSLATDASGDGVFEVTWQASDYQLLPPNPTAAPEPRPYTAIKAVGTQLFPYIYAVPARSDRVQVAGVWGWPAVPFAIKQAAAILAAEMFKLKDAPFGVAGFGDYGVVRIRENPKLAAYAGPYRRNPTLVA